MSTDESDAITMRAARADDWRDIAELAQSAYWTNFEILEPGAGETAGYRERVRAMFERDGRKLWPHGVIAECSGQSVGWGVRDLAMGWVRELWVAAEFQGRGVGRAILLFFIDELERHGHKHVFIDTHARNEGAIRLYEAYGFVRDKQEVHWSVGLQRQIPIVVMVRRLG